MNPSVDPSKIKPVPMQKTLVLVNNFVINTCAFLNGFSETCEKKVSVISSKVTQLEILLAVLEAKLNSVPGLEFNSGDLPTMAAAQPELAAVDQPSQPLAVPDLPPAPAAAAVDASPGLVAAKDHPDYLPFFKLLRVGVPPHVVQAKTAAAGLDPSFIETPDAMIPLSGPPPPKAPTGMKPLSRRIFDKFDRDNSGDISVNELQEMCMEFGVWLQGPALDAAMRTIDKNGDGDITYEEFLSWYKTSSFGKLALDDATLQRRQTLAAVFKKYDSNKNGSLDASEFRALHQEMRSLGLTARDANTALADIDSSGDGVVQFNELAEWLDREHK